VQAVELVRQVAAVDPADYERQMTATAGSVRAVGTFIAELADRSVHPHVTTGICVRSWSPHRDSAWGLPVCTSLICLRVS
jgi:hypothetical protein